VSLNLITRALRFAAQKHRDQRRKDIEASPYINHPVEVMHILAVEAGIDDPVILAAALLHDTLEDTETTIDELRKNFGDAVTDIVIEVTDDQSPPRLERYAQQLKKVPHYSYGAKLIRLADKIANIRDVIISPPPKWSAERVQGHKDHGAKVVELLRGTHETLERLFAEAYAESNKD
jgi:guanosine-3',5'-bis(diphosphate) 3'-pyrophosphohydrolase